MGGHDNHAFAADSKNDKSNSFSVAMNPREQFTFTDVDNTNPIESKKSQDADEYDPYLHREVKLPTTYSETLFHLLKSSLGTGILAMPLAFYHSGYFLGIVATALIGLLCTHCIHMLIQCEYELCKRRKIPVMTYPATAEAALQEGPELFKKCSSTAPHLVNLLLIIYQLGIGTVYTVFIGENIQGVLKDNGINVDARWVMLAILIPLILVNYVRNLKYLAPLSTIANFVTMISFGIIAYYIFNEDINFKGKEPFGHYKDYPLFFGTVLFALESIGVIMPLENEMKNPKKFGSAFGVFNIGMIGTVILYSLMGFFGYLAYGKDVGGSISYTIGNAIPAQICKIMLSFAIFITHALQLYPAIDSIWNMYLVPRIGKDHKHLLLLEYITRTVIVIISFALAVAVPYVDLFISLFGALTISALGLALPALLNISTYWDTLQGTRGFLIIGKNCLIILFGVLGLVIGTSTSLENIVEKFQR